MDMLCPAYFLLSCLSPARSNSHIADRLTAFRSKGIFADAMDNYAQ